MPDAPSPLPDAPARGIVVIAAHPALRQSRVNRPLMRAAARLRQGPGDEAGRGPPVKVRDLYALYPDYLIDVAAEQAALAGAALIVWLHPIQWYAPPALMKLWIDEVLSFGWAYGPGGTALRGKDLWLVASTGGPESSYRPEGYNRYPFESFLPPYRQTANLCGLRFLAPLVLHGAHRAERDEIDAHLATWEERLRRYPQWPELEALLYELPGQVPEDERPDDDAEPADAAATGGEPPPAAERDTRVHRGDQDPEPDTARTHGRTA